MYEGRFVTGLRDGNDLDSSVFASSMLVVNSCTEKADMLPGSSMRYVEDVNEEALPDSTDERVHLSQSEKFQQLGESAMVRLQEAVLQNLSTKDRKALVWMDLNMQTGDSFMAWLKTRDRCSLPVFYYGLCDSDVCKDFNMHEAIDVVAKRFLSGELKIPGHSRPEQAPPQDLLESEPSRPQLACMVWDGKRHGLESAKVPDRLISKWSEHVHYGEDFSKLISELSKEFFLDEKSDIVPEPSPKKKPRKDMPVLATEDSVDKPSPMDNTPQVKIDPGPGNTLVTSPMTNIKSGKTNLRITVEHEIFIENDSEIDIMFSKGTFVAGFGGKGKWKQDKGDKSLNPECDIVYDLHEGMHEEVMHNGAVSTVYELVEVKKNMEPFESDCLLLHYD